MRDFESRLLAGLLSLALQSSVAAALKIQLLDLRHSHRNGDVVQGFRFSFIKSDVTPNQPVRLERLFPIRLSLKGKPL